MKYILTSILSLLAVVALAQTQTNTDTVMQANTTAGPILLMKTSLGDIKFMLYDDTPKHRDNFLKLAEEGYYDGVLFHRVINNFMVQTGDPNSKTAKAGEMLGDGDPSYTIEPEFMYPKHYHKRGALAAARMGDEVNPERRSSGSQFYIVTGNTFSDWQLDQMNNSLMNNQMQSYFNNLVQERLPELEHLYQMGDQEGLEKIRQELIARTEAECKPTGMPEDVRETYKTVGGAPHLDGQYTVFGEVLEGMDVVDKIQKVETDANDRPKEDVRVLEIKVLQK